MEKENSHNVHLSTDALVNFWSPDVVEMMFQHLSPNEMLLAMEVAPSWFDFLMNTTTSKNFWENIVVKVNKENIGQITGCMRPYRHLRARDIHIRTLRKFILDPKCAWKTVELENIEFDNVYELSEIFQKIMETCEILQINNTSCNNFENADMMPEFDFPRLTNLQIQQPHKDHHIAAWMNNKIVFTPDLKIITLTEPTFTIELRTEMIDGEIYTDNVFTPAPMEVLNRLEKEGYPIWG